MSARNPGPSPARAVVATLASILAIGLIFAAGAKLNDPAEMERLFQSWGLGRWAIVPAGWIELVLGLLLFRLATRRLGALAMIFWVALFGALQLAAGQPGPATASAAVLLLCVAVLVTHKGPWAPRRPEQWIPAPLLDPPNGVAGAFFLLALIGLSFLVRWNIGGVLFWSVLPLLAWRHRRIAGERTMPLVEAVLLYFLVLGFGVTGIWNFVGHYLMSDTVAASIGWPQGSPFQHELAFYHLGMGFAGLLCLWRRDGFWYATALIPCVFLYGAMIVHFQDWAATGNLAPGNMSVPIVFGNLILPTIVLALLWARMRDGCGSSPDAGRTRESQIKLTS